MKVAEIRTRDSINYMLKVVADSGEVFDLCGIAEAMDELEVEGESNITAPDGFCIIIETTNGLSMDKLAKLKVRIEEIETTRF